MRFLLCVLFVAGLVGLSRGDDKQIERQVKVALALAKKEIPAKAAVAGGWLVEPAAAKVSAPAPRPVRAEPAQPAFRWVLMSNGYHNYWALCQDPPPASMECKECKDGQCTPRK